MLAESVAGELIDTEIEIRSGRAETFAEAVELPARAPRAGCSPWPSASGSRSPPPGTHPWANYLDQRIIDTEHYNRLREELRWVAQRNNTWSLHVHVGVRGADRAIAVCDHLRELLPPLLALSANSPFLDGQDTGLHSVRTEIFTRTFPRCGVHEPFGDWATYADFIDLLDARPGAIVESTQLWWSVRPHHAFGTVELRICDAQTRGDEAFDLAGADHRLHRPVGARLRRRPAAARRCASARSRRTSGGRSATASTGTRSTSRRAEVIETARGARAARSSGPRRRAERSASTLAIPAENGAQRARAGARGRLPLADVYREAVAETRRDLRARAGHELERES